MNLFHLLVRSEERLPANYPAFNEQKEVVQAILKAVGALPFRRANLNHGLHKLVAASIVVAHDADDSIAHAVLGYLVEAGRSTKLIQYYDKAVAAELLQPQSHRAEGRLYVGDTISTYLA